MILTGNVAMEDMGFKTFGFGGGRVDNWAPEEDVYWGMAESYDAAETADALEYPLGNAQMNLIYVNPEGPRAQPDPLAAAAYIRESFGRMSMGDEETVALIAGGHTFGKAHGAANPGGKVGPNPAEATLAEQGFGWKNSHGTGKGADAITSGLEGAWTANPTQWDHGYFTNLFKYDWKLMKGPGGAWQWHPQEPEYQEIIPDAHIPGKKHPPMMFTTDIALITDPAYLEVSKKFMAEPDYFADAFARAWYKLCHRDMGPQNRLLGPEVPPAQIWQDPVPEPSATPDDSQIASLKAAIQASGMSGGQLVRCAWASASTYRCTDRRGGANGARICLAPQKDWAVNNPTELSETLANLEKIRGEHGNWISMADMIVLAGCTAIETASGMPVPFTAWRGDATQEQTDIKSFGHLEPQHDAFRNYKANPYQQIDRAHMLRLKAPEMAVLVAGMRALGANADPLSKCGMLTATPGQLTNDFFVNLLDMSTVWTETTDIQGEPVFEGRDRSTGDIKWTASQCDLAFGSNGELRAIAEHYACSDASDEFKADFIKAWDKVMNNDRV